MHLLSATSLNLKKNADKLMIHIHHGIILFLNSIKKVHIKKGYDYRSDLKL